jgi:DNA-binding beta-propeller fold protein YncE
MRLVVALLALLALAGCSNRERSNPFDPQNPNTRGRPAGFMAIASDGYVDLRWTPAAGASLIGYRLYRRTAVADTFVALSNLLSPSVTSYRDRGLLDGITYYYRLYYVFSDIGQSSPADDAATPGRARPWVADASRGYLYRVTPDGRRVADGFSGFNGPTSVAVDPVRGVVWASDGFGGRVDILEPGSGRTTSLPGFVTPGALKIDVPSGVTWVCDEDAGILWELDSIGNPVGNPIQPLSLPLGVDVDPFDNSVLVCERNADRLRRFAPDHSLLASITVPAPSRVAVDSLTRRAWVTSFTDKVVYKVPPSFTAVEDTLTGFGGPLGIAVDPRRGMVWIADAVSGQVVGVDRAGAVQVRVGNLPEARDVAVDLATGDVWVTVTGRGEVAHLSSTGAVLQRLDAFAQPLGIAVSNGLP